MTTTKLLQERFFADLQDQCSHPAKHHYVMLSGGVDSFVLLCAVLRTHDPADVTALIIRSRNTEDYRKALQAAHWAGVNTRTMTVTLQTILDNRHFVEGTADRSVFQAMFRISTECLLTGIDLTGCAVYQGDGADSLYGNQSPFLYRAANTRAAQDGITPQEAKELLRREWRYKKRNGFGISTAKIIGEVIRAHGATAVQPYINPLFDYVMDVPLTAFQGDKKTWVKDGLTKHYGVPAGIAYSRKRCSMQEGTGLYELLQDELKIAYNVTNANDAIKQIAAGATV